jgi:hypothetical protein
MTSKKLFIKSLMLFLALLLPFGCFAQFIISGRILNQADTKPVANVSVFLSNSSIGDKTANDGTFTLHNVKPGKYQMVVSIVGFDTYNRILVVENSSIKLDDITIFPKTIALSEVKIKPKNDPYRGRNYDWFKEEFLGTSYIAHECTILNPQLLDLDYDDDSGTLTASSYDFLQIENPVLGYKIKYLLSDFKMNNKDASKKQVYYQGSVLYEEMKGTPAQEKRWKKNRQEVYANSAMHFLRAAASGHMEQEGFRVLKLSTYANPQRPSDELIEAKIKYYKGEVTAITKDRDSLAVWVKKEKLPKTFQKLITVPLKNEQIVKPADKPGLFELIYDSDALYVTYNKDHQFRTNDKLNYLEDPRNTENSLINFSLSKNALFYNNGVVADPYSVLFNGFWGRNRVADLLPVDFDAQQGLNTKQDNIVAETLVAQLKTFSNNHIIEKAYLHFDKPYYAAGDTIYFKAYLTMAETRQPSTISGVLHVDLINTNNKIDKSIKLQVTDGVGWGDFALPDSLPKGNYRVRAYTNWMRNDGEGAYFDQTIPVGSILNSKIPESAASHKNVNAKADMQFFPEGGVLLTGVSSKVAFKAIGTNGLGIDVKGVIVDNENREVASFASQHLGMGYVYLTPEEGRTYHAKLTFADGTQNTVDLPNAESTGISLSINNDSIPKASVRIVAGKAYYQENKGKNYTLIVYSGGVATTIACSLDSTVVTLDILKRRLHTGIATATLFSPEGTPMAERLFFVQNYDQLSIASNNKQVYSKREKVNISLNVKDRAGNPSAGHFSVAVIDESKVPVDEPTESTIFNNLLLTSDLKGYIERPNYYFVNINDKTAADLDLVMLTHGYRRFEWKQVLNNANPPLAYQPEKNLEITGIAKSMGGKLLANATVALIAMHDGSFTTATTNEQGKFRFSNLIFTDTSRFVLQAINAEGVNNTELMYDKEAPRPPISLSEPKPENDINQLMTEYMENDRKYKEETAQYGDIKGKMLKDVIINDKKIKHYPSNGNLINPEMADQLVTSQELQKAGGISLTEMILQKFYGRARVAQLIVVDGVAMRPDFKVDDLNPNEIETVSAIYGANASIYGVRGGKGVWLITTKHGKGLQAADIASIGILPLSPKGFYMAREFYAPKYDHADDANSRSDLRSTLCWKPEVITDAEGNASFEYYNADGTGSYRVVIEGIDENGNLGRQVYRYQVK